MSHITRENKQLKFLEISFTGYLALTQQKKRKGKLKFSDNAKSAPLTSGLNVTVMRSGLFGFSLILWRSRRRPRCR